MAVQTEKLSENGHVEPLPNYLITIYVFTIMLLTLLSLWLVLG